jgi:twitching motility two-component system response regulator PilG
MRLEFAPTTAAENGSLDEAAVPSSQDLKKVLKRGILAAKNGEREDARALLMQATEIDSLNEEAWMWLASISDYPEELVAFLTNVLAINPENERAKKWLARTESQIEVCENHDQGFALTEVSSEATAYIACDARLVASQPANSASCPFCDTENEPTAFHCGTCRAALSLSDIEALLSNPRADRARIYDAVTEMEAEWNLSELSEAELTALGIGHFNLRNYDKGQQYLRELLGRDANNVILAGQLNTLAIRLEEMQRHDELHEGKPTGKKILVVDDSATVRKLISSKLEKSGHNVVCAVDGVEGLEKIAEDLPDMVFLDISMPRKDGYEVCKEIRSNPVSKNTPVVMISGKDGFFDKVRGKMAGANGYVTKPFGPDALMKALETHLASEEAFVE